MASASAKTKQFWRQQHKNRAIMAFGEKCLICGQSFPNPAYDFHHINPKEKEFNFGESTMSNKNGWYAVRDELLKCVLLCANCHRIYHSDPNFFQIENKVYFNMDYYEWDDLEYQINHTTLERMCHNKKINFYCEKCGGLRDRYSQSNLCRNCYDIDRRFAGRPSKEELKILIRTMPLTTLARQFNVGIKSIRNWCDSYNLPNKKGLINGYSDVEWVNL